ncbi:MAG: nucleotidyltransferase family protein [Deltaproteobacteria bacterium]|nr:nucleotidyltransferase family protein [Deltaproteobacteria bacterium]
MIRPEDAELLCLLNLSRPGEQDKRRALALAARGVDWSAFFELTTRNSALILTLKRLRELGIAAPETDARRELEKSLLEAARARAEWAGRFLEAAAEKSVEVIVLKGGLLGSVLYGDPAYKKMNDVDVLVKREDAPKLADILRTLGFSSVGLLLGKNEFEDDSHHCPPFVSPDLRCMVGIHWGLTSPYSVWKPDHDEIWRARAPATVFGAPAFRMSWEENLLHLCIHLPFFKVGVRELADVYNLCLYSEPRVDWKRFDRLVTRWRAEDGAYRVLSLADALVPFAPPPELLARWKAAASPFTRRDTQERLKLGPALIDTRSVHIGKIEKAFTVFRLTKSYKERVGAWAMTWKLTFFPPAGELPRLVPGNSSPLKMRLLAGIYCWQAMARDYGQAALTLITLLNVGMVARDTVLRPFRGGGESIRKHPAAKLLEALE